MATPACRYGVQSSGVELFSWWRSKPYALQDCKVGICLQFGCDRGPHYPTTHVYSVNIHVEQECCNVLCSFRPRAWKDDAPYKYVKPAEKQRVCIFWTCEQFIKCKFCCNFVVFNRRFVQKMLRSQETGARNHRHKFDARLWSMCHAVWRHYFNRCWFLESNRNCYISIMETDTNGLLWLVDGFVYIQCFYWLGFFNSRIDLEFKEFAIHLKYIRGTQNK